MATKDYNLALTGISPVFDRGSQHINLNLNQNNSKYVSFQQSKIISNKNGRKFNENKNFDSKIENNNFGLNKSEKLFENLNLWNSENEVNQKKWKKDNFKESNILIKSSSTLSYHISAYENSIEASTATNESNSNTKAAKLDTKNDKPLFAPSISKFEIPRQQDDNDPSKKQEIMQFKSSQKLLNPNNNENAKPKNESENETNPPPPPPSSSSSAWSWLPSLFSSIFITKPPEKTLNESLSPIKQQQHSSTVFIPL
uniref:Uncharacterized protein n=1 Tax=Panagrolaimus sp. PS1159 TaxID=55785 RepID=A0AC35FCB2_9BILA